MGKSTRGGCQTTLLPSLVGGEKGEGDLRRLVRVGPDGGIFVLEKRGKQVVKFDPDGKELCTISKAGDAKFASPVAMDINPWGVLLIGDSSTSQIYVFKPVVSAE